MQNIQVNYDVTETPYMIILCLLGNQVGAVSIVIGDKFYDISCDSRIVPVWDHVLA